MKKLADECKAEGFVCEGYQANVLEPEALEAVHQKVLAGLVSRPLRGPVLGLASVHPGLPAYAHASGLSDLPTDSTPYSGGIKAAVIVMFCVIPMLAWAATLLAMKGYTLTGEKMKTIQAVNAARREAVAGGMSLEQAMKSITDYRRWRSRPRSRRRSTR